jgi:hypothetical protein
MAGAGILSFMCGILTAICLALSQGYAAGQLYGLTKYIDFAFYYFDILGAIMSLSDSLPEKDSLIRL